MRFYELTDGALGVVSLDPPCAFMIDAADRPMVESKRWYFVTNRRKQTTYVMCPENGTIRPIHRILMDAPKGLVVDHINGDPLDNRRANLRLCTHAQNMAANHRYKRGATGLLGVHFSPVPGKFWASISDNSKPPKFHSLGTFATAKEAALARDKEAYRLRGEFARLNYPDELNRDDLYEVVEHLDGDFTNNEITNLKIRRIAYKSH